jgi:hypothetical protein
VVTIVKDYWVSAFNSMDLKHVVMICLNSVAVLQLRARVAAEKAEEVEALRAELSSEQAATLSEQRAKWQAEQERDAQRTVEAQVGTATPLTLSCLPRGLPW